MATSTTIDPMVAAVQLQSQHISQRKTNEHEALMFRTKAHCLFNTVSEACNSNGAVDPISVLAAYLFTVDDLARTAEREKIADEVQRENVAWKRGVLNAVRRAVDSVPEKGCLSIAVTF